jgi:hypothetical protein
VRDLQQALEAAGVEFTNGDQPGVRLKKFKLKDAGKNAFHSDDLVFIEFGAVDDAGHKIIIRVQDLALQHFDQNIRGGAEHMRAFEEHRSKIFKIAARKYELGLVEPGEIISVRFDDVAR